MVRVMTAGDHDPTLDHPSGSDPSSLPPMPPAGAELEPGTRFGSYTVRSRLGQGGMGVVYRATQDRPERTVALKILRPGVATAQMLRRFEFEAEVLGRLAHPGIGAIYEAGTADTAMGPTPFFAMELVAGRPLDEHCLVHELSVRQRLDLVAQVADAVQHAHAKGVVHRDLKPANVLVGANGPKVLDFGVARLTDERERAHTLATREGQLVGTLPYMAPEQVAGKPEEVDTRTDVYALGVIAYQLLAGRLPFELDGKTVYESTKIIVEREAPKLAQFDRALRGDVETIVAKAMARDRAERYQSAGALADDIRRYLRDEPIEARPPSTVYQLRKFARRNKAVVGGVVAVIVVLAAGVVVTSALLARAVRAERAAVVAQKEAETEASRAKQAGAFARTIITGIDPETAKDRDTTLVRELVADAERDLDDHPPTDPVVEADGRDMIGQAQAAIGEPVSGERNLLQAMYLWKSSVDAGDHRLADTAAALARLRIDQGRLAEAGAALDDAPADPSALPARTRVEIKNVRAQLAFMSGDAAGALAQLDGALADARASLGEDDDLTLDLRGNRALLLGMTQNFDEAEAEMRAVVDVATASRGPADAKTLILRNNLATLYTQLGRFDDAERVFKGAVEDCERVFGPDHPETILTRFNRAIVFMELGAPDEALPRLESVFADAQRALGDDHPTTLRAMNALSNALRMTGDPDRARGVATKGLELAKRRLGEGSLEAARFASTLGIIASESGDLDEAERRYRASIDGLERTLGDRHSETLTIVSNLANVVRKAGRLDEAEPLARRALEGQVAARGEGSYEAMVAHNTLASLLLDAGRTAEALPHLRATAEAAKTQLPAGDANLPAMQLRLGKALLELGKLDEAGEVLPGARDGLAAALGEDHPLTKQADEALANLNAERGDRGNKEP